MNLTAKNAGDSANNVNTVDSCNTLFQKYTQIFVITICPLPICSVRKGEKGVLRSGNLLKTFKDSVLASIQPVKNSFLRRGKMKMEVFIHIFKNFLKQTAHQPTHEQSFFFLIRMTFSFN